MIAILDTYSTENIDFMIQFLAATCTLKNSFN